MFNKFIILFYITILSSIPEFGLAQGLHTISNKALREYNDGKQAYNYFDFTKAESYLKEAIRTDPGFYEAYLIYAEMLTDMERFEDAKVNYKKVVKLDSTFYFPAFYGLANAEIKTGDYANAAVHFRVYLENNPKSDTYISLATKGYTDCLFAIDAIKNPVKFNPVNLGDSINTRFDEYWPSITADGQTFMFTRQVDNGNSNGSLRKVQEDFYVSSLENNIWSKAMPAGLPLNTTGNEGAQTLSSNGQYMFFTACDRRDGLGRCDIYYSSFDGNTWSEPRNAGAPINSASWDSQPSINAEGRVLYFTSNRSGGMGGMDIWYSVFGLNGTWGKPVNLGGKVNTKGDEMSPFIYFDSRTLYFSSNGLAGMGGFDLYSTRMLEDSTWTEPVNLGYPINSFNDETGLVISSDGSRAYYSSKLNNERGKDLFYFDMPESLRPEPVSYLKGKVYEKITGKILTANYELINLTLGKTIVTGKTDAKGNFLVCLPFGYNYGLNVNKEGYLFYSENFKFDTVRPDTDPYIKRVALSKIEAGEKLTLYNIFFETDSWELKKESQSELDKLFVLLNSNKDLVVEIGGHTDSTGTTEHNRLLSENRAKSVVSFLKSKGITELRMKYKGYGDSLPVGDNNTSDGRQMNRRTEVKILNTGNPDLKK